MIRHIVLTKAKDGAAMDEIYAGLRALTDKLDGAKGFTGGLSNSPEPYERGFTHGFTIDFDTWESLAQYAKHPEHKALGARLVAATEGGVDGLMVMDIEV